MLDLSKSVSYSGGLVDLEATLRNVAAEVAAYNTGRENDLEKVGAAVTAVFAQYPGASITKPALVSLTFNKLGNISPDLFTEMKERIESYIATQVEAGMLNMKKGKGG